MMYGTLESRKSSFAATTFTNPTGTPIIKSGVYTYSREEVLEEGLFGNIGSDRLHPTFTGSSLGDFVAVATGDKALVNSRKSHRFKSHHAGATEKEMIVPFIAVDVSRM